MRVLAFAPMHNTGTKKDATGAFQPEARAFLRYHGQTAAEVVLIDNQTSPMRMRLAVYAALRARAAGVQGIAFFCHGFRSGIQFGFRSPDLGAMLSAIPAPAPDLRVTLYACDAARDADRDRDDDRSDTVGGDGGFADTLRDRLSVIAPRCVVDAHTTAAHTTRNPDVRRFEGPAGAGGRYLIARGDPLWPRWREALRGPMRFAFPFMPRAEIVAALLGPRAPEA